jgi:hypothetical protein
MKALRWITVGIEQAKAAKKLRQQKLVFGVRLLVINNEGLAAEKHNSF